MTPAPARGGALWPSLLPPSQHGRDDLCAVSADGVRIRFADGAERLCATSGLWNVPLGYGNAAIADAIGEAARRLSYGSVFRYENADARAAADALLAVAGRDSYSRVLFSTSGGAANDLVMKLARHHQALRGESRRRLVVGLHGSFHGMTFGGFSLTGEALGQELYGVDRRLVRHVDPHDPAAAEQLLDRLGPQVAAVVLEPVLGSGAVPLPDELVDVVCRAREQHGFLLVADEVATGFARTGPMFASSEWPVPPDALITSKALTNGTCAAAAVLVGAEVADAFARADAVLVHAETQAGTATTAAAVLATLQEVERLDVVGLVADLGPALARALDDVVARVPAAVGHTGRGAFRSLRLVDRDGEALGAAEVPAVVDAVRAAGVVVHPGLHGVQLVPALVYGADDLSALVAGLVTGLLAWQGGWADGERLVDGLVASGRGVPA